MSVTKIEKPFRINFLPTHFLPHFDEVFSCFLFWNFPHPNFKGADEAVVQFWNAGRKTPDGVYADEAWVRKNCALPIGCAGSMLDEHPREEETREDDAARKERQECAASLVAQLLEIDQLPQLQSLLRFARRVDNTATADPRDISSIIKKLHDNRESNHKTVKRWVKDPVKLERILELLGRQIPLDDMFEWVEQGIYAKYCEPEQTDDFTIEKIAELIRLQGHTEPYTADEWLRIGAEALELDQLLFETVTAAEYKAYGVISTFRGRNQKGQIVDMKLAFVSSDDTRIHRFARSKLGDQVAVTVQRRRNGTYVIQSNKYYGIRMHDVARALITEEKLIRREELPSWSDMRRQLQHSVWYYFVPGEALFNGAKTSPDVDPSQIPLPRLIELVKTALSAEMFVSARSESCLQGICSSTRRQPCPWYKYGLSRCQSIRWEARRTEEEEQSGK